MTGFPKDFAWGAATASYQIEGGWNEGGRGLSVWDMCCRQPGFVYEGHTGDTACDHYNRWQEDIGLMKEIGLKAYRLSLAWPRILPEGTGKVNEEGLAFYDRLVDGLLEANIEPWVTLFHWDFPYDLFLRGGWFNKASPSWFEDYTRVVVDRLSDRVSHWMTLNEPQVFIGLGHDAGFHAPGLKYGMTEVLLAGHHALLAHGRAVSVIREHARKAPSIGWAPVGAVAMPPTESPEDIEAARTVMMGMDPGGGPTKVWSNTWWGDPVVLGQYPEDGLELFGKQVPAYTEAEMQLISQPIDFYGANMYVGSWIRAGEKGPEKLDMPPGTPETLYGWKVTPDILRWGPRFLHERYKLPIVVTENGLSNMDWVAEDGRVHDPQRIDYLSRHLKAVRAAIADGVDFSGYFCWSLLDNFEWNEGYKHRFGLIHVDFTTLKRTPKDSAYWYRDVIQSNGGCL